MAVDVIQAIGSPRNLLAIPRLLDLGGSRSSDHSHEDSFLKLHRVIITISAFGLEDFQYSGTGTLQTTTSYYSLAGRLMGVITGLLSPITVIFLTDALGNLMATFNNTQGSAAVQGNQVYGPYGNSLYSSGSMDTARGYTDQYRAIPPPAWTTTSRATMTR